MKDVAASADLMQLTAADVKSAAALSAIFGWPHRSEDWALMINMGRGLKLEMNGKLCGTIMWWPLGNGHVTIGMIMVSKSMQSHGLGTRLLHAAIAENDGMILRLNATPEGMALYRHSGFESTGVISQNQGIASVPVVSMSNCGFAGQYAREQIILYDEQMTGLKRVQILDVLLKVSDIAVATETDGKLTGYALCRVFGKGRVIGPVVANDLETARGLIALYMKRYVGSFLRIDTHEDHGLSPWLEAHGLSPMEPASAMRLGCDPSTRAYALASQALG